MKKIVFILLLLLAYLFLSNSKVFASVLFEDDFEDGNSNGWINVMGPNIWEVKDINGNKMYGARINVDSTIIDSVSYVVNTPNYQIDFDYLPVVGVDRNLDFRWINNNPHEVHFINEDYVWTNFGHPDFISPILLTTNQLHHIRIILENQRIQFLLNGIK